MAVEDLLRNIAFPMLRFGVYTAHALICGLVAILLLVLRPSFATLPHDEWEDGRVRVSARLEGLIRAALLGATVMSLLILLLQAALVSELGTGEVTGDSIMSVLETTFGQWTAVRFPLLAALAVLLIGRVKDWSLSTASGKGPTTAWWLAWATLGVCLMSTSTFSGHALVATPKTLSIVNDIVHLVAGAVWFSGIIVLAAVLPDAWRKRDKLDRLRLMTPAVVSFSHVAIISIAIVALTGLGNSLLHVGSINDLWDTSYGQVLAVKLILFAVILALGALNHFVVREKLRSALSSGTVPDEQALFRKVIRVELAIALAIMAATGIMTYLSRTKGAGEHPEGMPSAAHSIHHP